MYGYTKSTMDLMTHRKWRCSNNSVRVEYTFLTGTGFRRIEGLKHVHRALMIRNFGPKIAVTYTKNDKRDGDASYQQHKPDIKLLRNPAVIPQHSLCKFHMKGLRALLRKPGGRY